MAMRALILAVVAVTVAAAAADDTYFLPALKGKTGPTVALVMIQAFFSFLIVERESSSPMPRQ